MQEPKMHAESVAITSKSRNAAMTKPLVVVPLDALRQYFVESFCSSVMDPATDDEKGTTTLG